MTWEEAQSQYVQALRGRRRARTLANFTKEWARFLEVVAVSEPAQLSAQHLRLYLEHLLAQPVKKVTAWGYWARLLPFARWLYRQGVLFLDPTEGVRLPRFARSLRRPLSVEEVQRLLASPHAHTLAGQRDRALLELFYGTGLRLGEVQSLEVSDVRLSERCLGLRQGKIEPDWVPLGRHLTAVLSHYLAEVRPLLQQNGQVKALWLNLNGGPMSYHGISLRLRKLARRAGLKPISPHALRHAFATHLLKAGAPLLWVQALLRHKSLLATQVYTHLTGQDVLREFRRTHPRARRRKRERAHRAASPGATAAGPTGGHSDGLPSVPEAL